MGSMASAALPLVQLGVRTVQTAQSQRWERERFAQQQQAEQAAAARQLALQRSLLAADQQRDEQAVALSEAQAADNAAAAIQQLADTRASTEARRIASLRRAVAKRQASLAGQGLSAADGSGEAVLLGVVRDSEAEATSARSATGLQIDAIRRQLDQTRQRNLLELTQAAQRRNQRLVELAGG